MNAVLKSHAVVFLFGLLSDARCLRKANLKATFSFEPDGPAWHLDSLEDLTLSACRVLRDGESTQVRADVFFLLSFGLFPFSWQWP